MNNLYRKNETYIKYTIFRIHLTHIISMIILLINAFIFTNNLISQIIQIVVVIIIILHDLDDKSLKRKFLFSIKTLNNLAKKNEKNNYFINKYVIYSKTTLDGIIIDVSDAFCNLSGYSKKELIGNTHAILKHKKTNSLDMKKLWNTISNNKTFIGEILNKKKNGNSYWVKSIINPEYNNNKKIGYMAIYFDITDKINFQKQHKLLIQSEKISAIGEMIGNIAHQWRQPLNTISTIASSMSLNHELNNTCETKKSIEYLNTIVKNTQFLSETIDIFRDYIKDNKSIMYNNLLLTISNAITIVKYQITNNNINLINNINLSNNIDIKLAHGELCHALVNIINNAKDALLINKIKNPYIQLDLKQTNTYILISIKDNAGGINKDIIKNIFQPYFTTKHQSQGTGLGLYMSYKIISEKCNGILYIENIDQGATFFIKLNIKNN